MFQLGDKGIQPVLGIWNETIVMCFTESMASVRSAHNKILHGLSEVEHGFYRNKQIGLSAQIG